MRKINVLFNLLLSLFIVGFFSFIFVKNFSQFKDLFLKPEINYLNQNESTQLIKDLEKNLENYFNLINSAN